MAVAAGERLIPGLEFICPSEPERCRNAFQRRRWRAAWAAILLMLALAVRPYMRSTGALFLLICFAYACGRVLMQFARENNAKARLSLAHVISGVILALSGTLLIFYW